MLEENSVSKDELKNEAKNELWHILYSKTNAKKDLKNI